MKKKPAKLNAYCDPGCGRGCTKSEHDKAVSDAKKLQKMIGRGWGVRVWDNLGWHYQVTSPCGALAVYKHGNTYTANLKGRWVSHGRTPRRVIQDVIYQARVEADEIISTLAIFAHEQTKATT